MVTILITSQFANRNISIHANGLLRAAQGKEKKVSDWSET